MPSIKDQSTVRALAREFCSNGRNATQALVTIGYSYKYADRQGHKVLACPVSIMLFPLTLLLLIAWPL